jgi:hypothetical protein
VPDAKALALTGLRAAQLSARGPRMPALAVFHDVEPVGIGLPGRPIVAELVCVPPCRYCACFFVLTTNVVFWRVSIDGAHFVVWRIDLLVAGRCRWSMYCAIELSYCRLDRLQLCSWLRHHPTLSPIIATIHCRYSCLFNVVFCSLFVKQPDELNFVFVYIGV